MMIIDSHQHFWQLSRGDYAWLSPRLKSLYRDFLPKDLEPILKELNVYGTILIQAAPTMDETLFLLNLASQHKFILGVIGWVDMESPNAPERIHQLALNTSFRGIRPMIQDISDPNWILRKEIVPALKKIEMLNLTLDALIFPQHITNLIKLMEQHPLLKVVVDHGAKPFIKNKSFEPWASDMKILAEFPNVYCKLSGFLTEAGENWLWDEVKPFLDHLFYCFGFERIMWGSDFPVLNLVSNYKEWFSLSQNYLLEFGQEECELVLGMNAKKFYGV